MDLYLIRHGIAAERSFERWPNDADRPLTPRGEAQFREAARGLAGIVASVDVALASPYARAWRTAELLHEETGWPSPKACRELEADRGWADALAAVARRAAEGSVALVGHEPNLSELASQLLTGRESDVPIDMKKGGVLALTLDGEPGRGRAYLRWLITPKVLRALG
jgi:phosphohistidine phosphatase